MATTLIDTRGCNSDYIISLNKPFSPGTYLTIRDNGSNPSFFSSNSIIISTVSGYSFDGGEESEYIRRPGDSLTFTGMTSNWVLVNTYAYKVAGYLYRSTISTTGLISLGPASFSTINIRGNFETSGKIDSQELPTIQGIPVINTSNVISTVDGIGSLGYMSSIPVMTSTFTSTVEGLSGYTYGYISTSMLTSTVAGLGSTYISTGSIQSTISGLSNYYIISSGLISTIDGIGDRYISTLSLASTVAGIGSVYISTGHLTSTVSNVINLTSFTNRSTFANIGLDYISSRSLFSTVLGASNIYTISSQFFSVTTGIVPYFSVNTVSTATGLGKMYVSSQSLVSTTAGIYSSNQSNLSMQLSSLGYLYVSSLSLQSTFVGLATGGYISLSQFTSTTDGVNSTIMSNIISTVTHLGQTYVSSLSLHSTVTSLSDIETPWLTSTLDGLGSTYISSQSLSSTIAGLGTYGFVSLDQLISTTSNIISTVSNSIPSTIAGLGTIGYISFPQLDSTIAGITQLTRTNLTSTFNTLGKSYISSLSLQSTVEGLGTFGYLSLSQLTSTTSNIITLRSNYIQSTLAGLGSIDYVSISQLNSTVQGFSDANRSNLVSSFNTLGFSYISSLSLQSTVAGLGTYGHVSLSQLTSTTLNTILTGSNRIQVAFSNMSNVGYVLNSQTTSTMTGIRGSNVNEFISSANFLGSFYVSSLSLQSTVANLGTFGYVSLSQIISTTEGIQASQYDMLFNNLASLGSLSFISTPTLTLAVGDISSNTTTTMITTVMNLGENFVSKPTLITTVAGLGTLNFVSSNTYTTAYNEVNTPSFINLNSNVELALLTTYLKNTNYVSTISGLDANTSSNLISTVNKIESNYSFIKYISVISTVNGLGSFGHVSIDSLVATTLGIESSAYTNALSTFVGLGTAGYISIDQLVSIINQFSISNLNFFQTTTQNLGSLYFSSFSLQSTVSGLSNSGYLTPSQLISTQVGLPNPTVLTTSLVETVNNLGPSYITFGALYSTVTGLGSVPYKYISSPSLVSTVSGLGTFGYLSSSYLFSTASATSNIDMGPFTSTIAGLGQTYFSSIGNYRVNPDMYRVQTVYSNSLSITALTCSSNKIFFCDAVRIYSSSFPSISPAGFSNIPNVTGLTCYGSSLYISYSNMIISLDVNTSSMAVIANTNNTAGFANSTSLTTASTPATVSFRSIQGICVDASGKHIYVCDLGNNALRRVTLGVANVSFAVTTIATVSQPYAVAVSSNYIYVTGSEGVTSVSLIYSNVYLLTSEGAFSRGISLDQTETLGYVTLLNNTILELNLSNGYTTILAGSPGITGSNDEPPLFNNLTGIVFNQVDKCIYVADTGNRMIRQITSRVYYSTILGLNANNSYKSIGASNSVIVSAADGVIISPFLQVWLDAADPNGVGAASVPAAAIISSWKDKSGRSNNAIASYVNSNDVMRFSPPVSSNGYIQLPPNTYFLSPYKTNYTPQHLFFVFKYTSTGSSGLNDISLISGGSDESIQLYIYNNFLVLGSRISSQNYAKVTPNIPNIAEIITTPTYSSIYINNVLLGRGSGYRYDTSELQIGGNTDATMSVCEVLSFNAILSSNITSNIFTYLNTKWVAPLTLPNATVVGLNPVLWLDGSDPLADGSSLIGTTITNWIDKSKNSYNVSGMGRVTSNGIFFDGSSGFMTNLPANIPNQTIFAVFNTPFMRYQPILGSTGDASSGVELMLDSNGRIQMDLSYPSPIVTRTSTISSNISSNTSSNLSSNTTSNTSSNTNSNVGSSGSTSTSFIYGATSGAPIAGVSIWDLQFLIRENRNNLYNKGTYFSMYPTQDGDGVDEDKIYIDNITCDIYGKYVYLTVVFVKPITLEGYYAEAGFIDRSFRYNFIFRFDINLGTVTIIRSTPQYLHKYSSGSGSGSYFELYPIIHSIVYYNSLLLTYTYNSDAKIGYIGGGGGVLRISNKTGSNYYEGSPPYLSVLLGYPTYDNFNPSSKFADLRDSLVSTISGPEFGLQYSHMYINSAKNQLYTTYYNNATSSESFNIFDLNVNTSVGSTFRNSWNGYINTYRSYLAFDHLGNVYMSIPAINKIILKAQVTGITSPVGINSIVGTNSGYLDGPATIAQFNLPHSITVDEQMNAYVADVGNNKIRKIDIFGNVTTVPTTIVFNTITSITYANGTLFVCDNIMYPRIISIQISQPTLSSGSGTSGSSGSTMPDETVTNVTSIGKDTVTSIGTDTITSISNTITTTSNITSVYQSNVTGTDTITLNTNTLFDVIVGNSPKTVTGWFNGNATQSLSGTLTSFVNPGNVSIGQTLIPGADPYTLYFGGTIQEIIIFNSNLGTTQRTTIETYLRNKWIPSHIPGCNQPTINLSYFTNLASTRSPTSANMRISGGGISLANLYTGNLTSGNLVATGKFYGDGTFVTTISDRRLKEDIRPIMNALDKVSSMQAVRYRLHNDPSHLCIGYIAQDLEAILPEVVRTDAEGWKSIQYTNLPGLIIEAVKELNEKYSRIKYLLSNSS